jgi:exosortase
VVGLGIYLLGMSGEEEIIQRLSFPITLMGLIYFLNGKRLARICLFSIGYLFLMIPIPYTLYKTLALKLRLLDAQLAASWSSFLGIPIFREADLLYLPQITLEVADGCSGVLSIVALLSLGIFYIYQLRIKPWGKALLLALLIPVAVLANVIRIVTIVVLVHNSGTWVLNTVIHKFNGVFNFILGFMTIVMVGAVMNKISLRRKTV